MFVVEIRKPEIEFKRQVSNLILTDLVEDWTPAIKKGLRKLRNPLIYMAGATRLELATSGLTGPCASQKKSFHFNYLQ